MVYAFIAMAGMFGAVLAYVMFTKPPQGPQVVYVPGATVVVREQAPSLDPSAAPTAGPAESVALAPTKPVPGGGGGNKAPDAKTAAPTSTGTPLDVSGFGSGGPGPATATPGGGVASGGTGQLDAGEISAVVNKSQGGIKRKCWQNALDS